VRQLSCPIVLPCLNCTYARIVNTSNTCPICGMTGRFATPKPAARRRAGDYGFLHLAAASALRWWTGQFPCRKTGALRLPPDRIAVAAERSTEYTALSIGCKARLALLTALGVTARFTARPGCMARRTLRGTNNLEKKPTRTPSDETAVLKDYSRRHSRDNQHSR
jgi:hypothetical protein